jgi:hypothetical protein
VCSSSDFLVAYHSACMDSSRAGRFPEATARLIPISTVSQRAIYSTPKERSTPLSMHIS